MVRNKFQPSSNYGIVHEDGIALCFSLRFVELYNNTSSDISEMISIDTGKNSNLTDSVTAYSMCRRHLLNS